MNKNEFLARLRSALASLPFEECQSAMKYYEEYFAEAGEDREGDILKELGSPEMLAATILGEYSSSPTRMSDVYATATPGYSGGVNQEPSQEPWYRRAPLWVLVLLCICLSPVILPLLGVAIGLCGGILGLVAGLAGIIISIGVSGVAFSFGGLIMVVIGTFRIITISPAVGVLTMGTGLLMLGLGVLVVLAVVWVSTNVIPPMFRAFVGLIRRIFNRGGMNR